MDDTHGYSSDDEFGPPPNLYGPFEREAVPLRSSTPIEGAGGNLRRFPSCSSLRSQKSSASVAKQQRLKTAIEAQLAFDKIAEAESEAKMKVEKLAREKKRVEMELQLKSMKLENELSFMEYVDSDDEDSTEDFKRKINTPTVASTFTVKPEEIITHVKTEDTFVKPSSVAEKPNEDPVMQLVTAMKTAFTSMQNPKTETTEKMLARQSHAKELPIFAGKPDEWPIFFSAYKRSSEVCGFSESENILRLQKCLKGDALDSVKCLLVSPENIKTVLETLEMRFGRPEHIIRSLFEKVKEVSRVKEDKLDSLIQFGTAVVNLVSTVKSLGRPSYNNNPLIVEELEGKLPTTLVMEWVTWVHSTEGRERSLEYFSQWLTMKMKVACVISPRTFSTPKKEDRDDRKKKSHSIFFNDGKEKPRDKKSSGCLWCKNGGHSVDVCRKFKAEDNDKKWEFTKKNRLCFICRRSGHVKGDCKVNKACGIDGCDRMHHQSLHKTSSTPPKEPNSFEQPEVSGSVNGNPTGRLLRVIPVTLKDPAGTVKTHALLDEGSTITMLRADVGEKLGLQGKEEPLCIQWIDEQSRRESKSQRVSLDIKGHGKDAKNFVIKNVRTVEELNLPSYSLNLDDLKKKWPHLRPLQMESIKNSKPTLLIGIDNAKLTAHRGILEGPSNAPIATKTKLGWAVGGPTAACVCTVYTSLHVCEKTESDKELHEVVKHYFSTESFGVKLDEGKPQSRNDDKAIAIMEATTRRVEGCRWETGLLWRNEDVHIPGSKQNAFRRLLCQERRMDKDPNFATQYCGKMDEYEMKGFIRKLTPEEAAIESVLTWYLSHFGVYNPYKPGKIRLCFDAKEKADGVSLNSALLTGPDLLNSLQAVLMRFREKKIAFTGDIADMFHRVLMRKEDQSSQRFLWRSMDRDREPDVYVMNVLIFGATSSPASAINVKDKNAEEFQEQFPQAVEMIKMAFYMDDLLGNADNEEEAARLIKEIIAIHEAGAMKMCKFLCNSRKVMETIPLELRADGTKGLQEKGELPVETVLGLWWDSEADAVTFKLNFHKVPEDVVKGRKVPTKRDMSKLVMSVFDPLGFISPFKVTGLALLQSAWRNEIGWDDEVPGTLFDSWKRWLLELPTLRNLQIPRCYSLDLKDATEIQLHTFVDASEEAYCAVSFLRMEIEDRWDVAFVSSKVRIAPIKRLTIPRMELMAALMGTRLAKTIEEELTIKVARKVYWSASKTVLCWIRSEDGRFQQFVSNRVGEIHEKSDAAEWRWIPTLLNVADDATRANSEVPMDSDCRWLRGPEFLKLPADQWPTERRIETEDVDEVTLELKRIVGVAVAVEDGFGHLPEVNRFSSWLRLIRSTAAVKKYVDMLKSKITGTQSHRNLTVDDLKISEMDWWRRVQRDSFFEELQCLLNGNQVPKKSRLAKLSVFIDSLGILRVRGRVNRSKDLLEETKNPVVLDPKHDYTRLLLDHYHMEGAHQGQERVVNTLREKFWILDIRTAVRSAWNRCGECLFRRAKPLVPEMGDLPGYRMESRGDPFSSSGVDFFGPMEVTIGRRKEKRWGVVFTCMVTRAIHLEVSPSLDTDHMLMSLMRFINR